ncbi:MAG: TAXI family TRAP transporter solute-binding subunit [Xanthobacteraceae bacterium]|nr:TAXI family TRAP transporter solute-binding subunit [Xanthobacteraceae bacterium]
MPIRIGTSELDGTFHSQGRALKVVLERQPSLAPVEVLTSDTASVENANRLHADEIAFGFMASNWIGRAMKGEAPFANPIDIRMAAPMNAGPLFFIARKDSPIRSVADLGGRKVVLGPEKSGMVQHAHTIFGVLGLAFTDFTPVYLDFETGADALASGEVDAQLQCPIPNKVMTALSEQQDIRVLPYAPGQLEKLLGAVSFYRRVVMRKDALRGLDADVAQPGVVNILATHARTPEATVRAAVAAIVAGAPELASINALFDGLGALFEPLKSDGAKALEFGGVTLHAGAAQAYRDAGLLA